MQICDLAVLGPRLALLLAGWHYSNLISGHQRGRGVNESRV